MDDYEFDGASVLVRTDINSPVKDGKIIGFSKLTAASQTLKELSEKNAKVVVLAHQGRKGRDDFIHLDQHAEKLFEIIGRKVEFIDDVIGERAIKKIKSLEGGDILLLDNVRFVDGEIDEKTPEEHQKGELVRTLSPLFDVYINDAFPSSHRSHASVVGFSKLPCLIGRWNYKEINFLEMVMKDPEEPAVLMFGGAKIEEPLLVIKNIIDAVDKVLVYGILGHLFLIAKDFELGEQTKSFLKEKGYLEFVDRIKKMVVSHDDKIETPIDFAFEENGTRVETDDLPVDGLIKDIGDKTIEKYSEILRKAKTVILKGPAGVYEEKQFQKGTKKMFEEASNVKFSLLGGGHSTDAIEDLCVDRNKFSHISLSGGAFIEYLSGKKLPGIEILKVPQ